jgi:hypothetical protein
MSRKNWFKALFMAMMLVSFTSIMRAGAQREEPPLFRRLLPDIDPEDLPHLRSMLATYVIGKMVIAAVNTVLLLYLLRSYYQLYQTSKSSFSLGLVMMSVALLMFTLSSAPLLHWMLGARKLMGAFNILPDIFTTIAAAILVYLSRQ